VEGIYVRKGKKLEELPNGRGPSFVVVEIEKGEFPRTFVSRQRDNWETYLPSPGKEAAVDTVLFTDATVFIMDGTTSVLELSDGLVSGSAALVVPKEFAERIREALEKLAVDDDVEFAAASALTSVGDFLPDALLADKGRLIFYGAWQQTPFGAFVRTPVPVGPG